MKVTQPNSRSITVVSDSGVTFHVPYRFYWNGHERPAESIVLVSPDQEDDAPVTAKRRGRKPAAATRASRTKSAAPSAAPAAPLVYDVRAFFLFGEIRDRIIGDAAGITIARTWSVKTPGSVHLSVDVEFDAPSDLGCLFPGVHACQGLPQSPLSFLGERTSYPSSLFLSLGKKGVLIFSRSTVCEGDPAGIGICRTEVEDAAAGLRVQVRFPGIEEPAGRIGPGPEDLQPAVESTIESPGSLDRSHEVHLAFSSREEITVRGPGVVLKRLVTDPAQASPGAAAVDKGLLAEAVRAGLAKLLHQKGGVAGMRETAGSPWLSSAAGLGCAVALRRLFPGDGRLLELSLRLADFSLKGQLASGFFHESFDLESGAWRGVRGSEGEGLLSVGQSARVAELLLAFSEDLARQGVPHEKYFLAGARFVDFFIDEKGRMSVPGGLHRASAGLPVADPNDGLSGLELFFPTAKVFAKTGRDRYRKALYVLVKHFSELAWDPFAPPCSREGRGADAAGAVLAARLFLDMRRLGYKPVEPPVSTAAAARARAADSVRLFASLIVPWVRIHAGDGGAHTPSGCLLDAFVRQRLLFAGHETALLLMQLEALTPDAALGALLGSLARHCLEAARAAPLGTAWVQHTVWDHEGKTAGARGKRGPLDSRRLAVEVLSGLRIAEEFPDLARRDRSP